MTFSTLETCAVRLTVFYVNLRFLAYYGMLRYIFDYIFSTKTLQRSLLTQHVGVDTKIEFYVRQNWIYSTISIAATILAAILNFEQVPMTHWLVSLFYMKQDIIFDIIYQVSEL